MDYNALVNRIAQNQDLLLINIMPEADYNAAHIPGSVNMPLDSESFIDDIAFYAETKDAELVLYAENENMSLVLETAHDRLHENGFTNISIFEEGITGWKKSGAPLKSYDGNLSESTGNCSSCGDCGCS